MKYDVYKNSMSRVWWRGRIIALFFTAAAVALPGISQTGNVSSATIATIAFRLNFPQSDPSDYSLVIDENGHGHYESTGAVAEGADFETYHSQFNISAEARKRVFDLAKRAHYFAGTIDSGNHKLAFTGEKVLSYRDARLNNSARYDYSSLAPVRELTSFFQGTAATLEYGRRLTYYHHYQKLALDEEMKKMEAEAKSNQLNELQIVAPVLEEIVDDPSVLNVVRARARELMQMGAVSPMAGGHNVR